jgi:uncharacterized membrane protein
LPYRWLPSDGTTRCLRLWPHRSLTNTGFAAFFGVTGALFLVPLLGLLGNPALWAILPFVLLVMGGLWVSIRRTDRTASEDMQLSPDRLVIVRRDPDGRERRWETNPYWVRVTLHETGGPVPNYLTLKGDGREVEVGAFLSEAERTALRHEIARELATLH